MAITKTLDKGLARVRMLLGTYVDDTTNVGLYDDSTIMAALNVVQRFIAKSFPEEALADLVVVADHTFTGTSSIGAFHFTKAAGGNGRVLNLGKESAFDHEIPIKSRSEWMRWGEDNYIPALANATNCETWLACEIGTEIYVRPGMPADSTIVEVYIADTVDFDPAVTPYSDQKFSIPDHLFDICCIEAAWMLATMRHNTDMAADLKGMIDGFSALFTKQWGVEMPQVAQQPSPTEK